MKRDPRHALQVVAGLVDDAEENGMLWELADCLIEEWLLKRLPRLDAARDADANRDDEVDQLRRLFERKGGAA
jgi:hypothetical protein